MPRSRLDDVAIDDAFVSRARSRAVRTLPDARPRARASAGDGRGAPIESRRVASSRDSSRVRTRRDRATRRDAIGARDRHRDATRRDRASEMSDDEVKQEVKEEHINIKVRDMVRARASDARDDASATRPTSRVVCDFEMTTNDGIWTTGSTRT